MIDKPKSRYVGSTTLAEATEATEAAPKAAPKAAPEPSARRTRSMDVVG